MKVGNCYCKLNLSYLCNKCLILNQILILIKIRKTPLSVLTNKLKSRGLMEWYSHKMTVNIGPYLYNRKHAQI